jgi:predicted amidohydrolase
MAIIPGAFIERSKNVNKYLQISAPVISDDGIILGHQLKIHPFGRQRKVVKAGTKVELFKSRNFKFGVGICYDIVFPEVARALVKKERCRHTLFPKIRYDGIKPWHMYVQVRALENRIPIAAPNVCDDDKTNDIYRGKSIFVDFDYDYKTDITIPKLKFGSSKDNQIIVIDIDLNRTRKLHNKRFEDFRSDLYNRL